MNKFDVVMAKSAAASAVCFAAGVHDITQILFVGFVGGLIGWMKRCDMDTLRATPIRALMSMPFSIAAPLGLTAVVFYGGVDVVNVYARDFGTPVWIFLGFVTALYYDTVLPAVAKFIPKVANAILDKFTGGKNV